MLLQHLPKNQGLNICVAKSNTEADVDQYEEVLRVDSFKRKTLILIGESEKLLGALVKKIVDSNPNEFSLLRNQRVRN